MKRMLGFLPCLLLLFVSCSGNPSPNVNRSPVIRPAFLVGDQVLVTGGEYAQSIGTVLEVDMESDGYKIQLANRPTPVFVKAYLLKKKSGAAQITRSSAEFAGTPDVAQAMQVSIIDRQLVTINEKIGRLAVLPIIGLEEYVGETIAWHFANEPVIRSIFDVVPITPQIRRNVLSEESYIAIYDPAIYDAGEDVQADYVMAGFARYIGCQKIFIAVVLDVKTHELLAGDFRLYDEVQDLQSYFPSMTRKITTVARNKKSIKSPLPLSVELMAIPPRKVQKNDASVLTQLLAISVANISSYSILPRTENFDDALLNYETRRTSMRRIVVNKDDITPAKYVLSSKIDIFDTRNQVIAEIVDIKGNVLHKGAHVNFVIIEDTPNLVGRLAGQLTSDMQSRSQQKN